MRRTLLAFILVTAGMAFSFRPEVAGSPLFWLGIGVPYLLLTALALYSMWNEGTLIDVLQPRWGDLSIGVVSATILLASSWAVRKLLVPPGTMNQGWLFQIYSQVGDPERIQQSVLFTLLIVLIAVAEEIVWRGMVLSELSERFGTRRAWPLTAFLYGATALPTIYTLSVPGAGLNPLLFIAALGCGIVWSFVASLSGRVPPVAFSHVAFTYFSLVVFRWPGM
jgi:membrane protease YdiL (CAAX protease family)